MVINQELQSKPLQSTKLPYPKDASDADLPCQPLNHDGIFVGFVNHPRVLFVWEPKKHRVSRVAHGIVDEFAINLEFVLRITVLGQKGRNF